MRHGTMLSGGVAAMLLALAPDLALAQDECGVMQPAGVTCDASSPYDSGINYAIDGTAPPQDLTIRLGDGVAVTSAVDETAGIGAVNGSGGDVTISGAGGVLNVSTSGWRSAGVSGVSTEGDVVIDVGDVSTSGDLSDGIYANTNFGSDGAVSIKAGFVTTSGEASVGVRAMTSSGDIDIDVGVVLAQGQGSDGIFATAYYGDATVKAGEVVTWGDGGRGVTVYSEGVTNVIVDYVSTSGQGFGSDFDAGGIKAVGTQVNVIAGTVRTQGDYSVGIYANTNHTAFDETVVDPNISVTAGTVVTSGFASDGIIAINTAEGGATRVDVNKIDVRGDYAWGVYASGYGDVTVNAGSIATGGLSGKGIDAVSFGGDIAIAAGSIHTSGLGGTGVRVVNYSQDGRTDIVVNKLETRRDYADGVRVEAYGDVAISVADLSTNGFASNGVSAISVDGMLDVTVGQVTTRGDQANGVDALSYYGQITINVGSVETSGANSAGVYAMGGGGITVRVDKVATSGQGALGIGAINFSDDAVTVTANAVTTSGPGSGGVVAVGYGGLVTVAVDSITTIGETVGPRTGIGATVASHYNDMYARFGDVSTAGHHAIGVFTNGSWGDQHLIIDRSVTTTGDFAQAILANQQFGDAVVDIAGTITTSGEHASGVSALVSAGDMTVNVAGSITTTGDDSAGISVTARSFGRAPDPYYGETEPSIHDGTIHVNANTVRTSGANSSGIVAVTEHIADYGDSELITNGIDIKTGTVTVTGEGSLGISATSLGRVFVDAGNTSSAKAEAIRIQAADEAELNVRGATVSKASDAVVMSGHDVTVTIARVAGVAGATNGLVLSAVGDDDPYAPGPVTPTGAISVDNAGEIVGGEGGYAVLAQQGQVVLTNSGRITGAIKLANGDDVITNSGLFAATADSDFGLGDDVFRNSGVFSATGSVVTLGLERFENSGLIDLRNGHTGDVLTLTGDYMASGDARLGLDLSEAGWDSLVVQGAASGKTTLVLGLTPDEATLASAKVGFAAAPLPLIQLGAGSTATFEIGNPDIGLLHYGLTLDPATQSVSLTAVAGAPVYATLNLQDSAQNAWRRSADAWSAHRAAMRADPSAEGGRIWAQVYGSNIGWGGYDQTDSGMQIGRDLGAQSTKFGELVWGVTGGFGKSRIERGRGESELETLDVGGYAGLIRGAGFIDGLVKYDHHRIRTSDAQAGYHAKLDGGSFGFELEAGRRFGDARLAFEPTVSLAYVRSDLDDLKLLGQALAFDDAEGLTGKIGARFSGQRQVKSADLVFFAGAAAVQTIAGDGGLAFDSGGISQAIAGEDDEAYGQATLGVNARLGHGVTTYLEGDGAFGGGREGMGLRLGARFNF